MKYLYLFLEVGDIAWVQFIQTPWCRAEETAQETAQFPSSCIVPDSGSKAEFLSSLSRPNVGVKVDLGSGNDGRHDVLRTGITVHQTGE